jgi:ribonuclease Z
VLGLPGLLQSLGSSEYSKKLQIFGPSGTKTLLKKLIELFAIKPEYDIEIHDVSKGTFLKNDFLSMQAFPLDHGLPTLGYSIFENDKRRINLEYIRKLGIPEGPLLGKLQDGKSVSFRGKRVDVNKATYIVRGKKISIILDTLLCDSCYKIAENADILIAESSYSSQLEQKAEEYKHLTAKQAALIASQSNVKKLVLTHFSPRYKNTREIEEDAKTYFSNVTCAYDFLKMRI